MKNLIVLCAVLAVIFVICFLLMGLIRKKMKKKLPMPLYILFGILTGLVLSAAAGFIYLEIHYPADESALAVLSDPSGAKVLKIDGGYMADGFGEDTALIFYPGAKVDTEAYLPLIKKIADSGIDCFLLDMPFRIAIFNKNGVDSIIDTYQYNTFLVGGHSMGGMIAATYASEHPETVNGVVLLAAYPIKELADSMHLLSVYGTEDKVLNHKRYESSKQFFPIEYVERMISGGNHSGFGNYGHQSGDGTASVSSQEQQEQTVKAILEFVENIK